MRTQYKLKSTSKGYSAIEYLFAMLLFIILLISISTYSENRILQTQQEHNTLYLSQLQNSLCLLLTTTPGTPSTWHNNVTSSVQIGLLNTSTKQLSRIKIQQFNAINYSTLNDILHLDNTPVTITLEDLSNSSIYINQTISGITIKHQEYCLAQYNNNTVIMKIGGGQ